MHMEDKQRYRRELDAYTEAKMREGQQQQVMEGEPAETGTTPTRRVDRFPAMATSSSSSSSTTIDPSLLHSPDFDDIDEHPHDEPQSVDHSPSVFKLHHAESRSSGFGSPTSQTRAASISFSARASPSP
jgi:hypothetical protein